MSGFSEMLLQAVDQRTSRKVSLLMFTSEDTFKHQRALLNRLKSVHVVELLDMFEVKGKGEGEG